MRVSVGKRVCVVVKRGCTGGYGGGGVINVDGVHVTDNEVWL